MSVSTPSLKSEIRDCKIIRNSDFFYYRNLLKRSYESAPYFKKTLTLLDEIYNFKNNSVSEFNINLVTSICSVIGIKTNFKISSKDFNCKCIPAENHILKILKNLELLIIMHQKKVLKLDYINPEVLKMKKLIYISKNMFIHLIII